MRKDDSISKMLNDYLTSYIVPRVIVEVVYQLILQSISKADYDEHKNEIIEQITCALLFNRTIRRRWKYERNDYCIFG